MNNQIPYKKLLLASLVSMLVACGSDSKDDNGGDITPPPGNTPPVATDTARITDSNQVIVINPLLHASDADEGDVLSLVAATSTEGVVSVLSGDRIEFNPDGFVGSAVISYTVSDGSDEDSASITVNTATAIFAGTQKCLQCHNNESSSIGGAPSHQFHGHNFKISKISNDETPSFPYSSVEGALAMIDNNGTPTDNVLGTPQSYAYVTYTSGGFAWKYRWLDKDGYIVTGKQAQNNINAVDECHTRDGDPNAKNGYVSSYNKAFPDGLEFGARIAVKGGLPRHHQGHDEFMGIDPDSGDIMGKHFNAGMSCASCHDSHKSAVYKDEPEHAGALVKECTTCHADKVDLNAGHGSGVDGFYAMACIDCHMPDVVKNATSATNEHGNKVGDIRIHTFAIDLYSDKGQFQNPDASESFMYPYLTDEFACGECHSKGQKLFIYT